MPHLPTAAFDESTGAHLGRARAAVARARGALAASIAVVAALSGCGAPTTPTPAERNIAGEAGAGTDASSDAAETALPVTVLVRVVRGIDAVPDAEVRWVMDSAPSLDGNAACRSECHARTDASGLARLRIRLATTDREFLGVWVRGGEWHAAACGPAPREPTPFLVDVQHPPHWSYGAELRVVDPDSRPVAGATVTVLLDRSAGPDPIVPSCKTGSDGCVVLPTVNRPHCTVAVGAAGYATIRMEPSWHSGSGEDTRRDRVELQRATPVSIRYAPATPGDVVDVEFVVDGVAQRSAYVLVEGVATVPLPAGPVSLTVFRDGQIVVARDVEVAAAAGELEIR